MQRPDVFLATAFAPSGGDANTQRPPTVVKTAALVVTFLFAALGIVLFIIVILSTAGGVGCLLYTSPSPRD